MVTPLGCELGVIRGMTLHLVKLLILKRDMMSRQTSCVQYTTQEGHNFWHHSWAKFFMLFHMAWLILFVFLFQETTFLLVDILQKPIRNFHLKVIGANARNKMDHAVRKSMKHSAWKRSEKLCAFLYEATCAFGKMCTREYLTMITNLLVPLKNHGRHHKDITPI